MYLSRSVDARPTTLPVMIPETMFPVKSPVTFPVTSPVRDPENPPKDVTTPTKSASPVSDNVTAVPTII